MANRASEALDQQQQYTAIVYPAFDPGPGSSQGQDQRQGHGLSYRTYVRKVWPIIVIMIKTKIVA